MAPTVPLFVGLDFSQHAAQAPCNARCPGAARIRQLVQRFGAAQGAALEACAGAADLSRELAGRFGRPMHPGHPGSVSRMKQPPDKSDFGDARALADLACPSSTGGSGESTRVPRGSPPDRPGRPAFEPGLSD